MRVSIIGTGRDGLVTAACLAQAGHEVVCVDMTYDRVAMINAKVAPFPEPGLDELLAEVEISSTLDLDRAVRESQLTMICAETESYVDSVAVQIGNALRGKDGYHVVVLRSPVVPGTTEKIVSTVQAHSGKEAGEGFGVGVNPATLSPGTALRDCREPAQIVLGGIDNRTWGVLTALYLPWQDIPTLLTDVSSAEAMIGSG